MSYAPELTISVPQALSADTYGRPLGDTHTSFDVTREGDFVFTRPVSTAASIKPRVHGVLNWAQGVR